MPFLYFMKKRKENIIEFLDEVQLEASKGNSVDDLRNSDHVCDCRKPMNEREHIDILTYDKVAEGLL